MGDIDQAKKIDILITALEERYSALRAIRDRVQSIGIWALGVLLAAGAWIIQSTVELAWLQKTLYVFGVLIAIIVLRFKYLSDLQRGFGNQQRVAVRLEKALGLFTPGVLDDASDAVYPASWKNAGTDQGDGKFFHTTNLLLYAGALFLIVAILFNGVAISMYSPERVHQVFKSWSSYICVNGNE